MNGQGGGKGPGRGFLERHWRLLLGCGVLLAVAAFFVVQFGSTLAWFQPRPLFCEWEPSEMGGYWRPAFGRVSPEETFVFVDRERNVLAVVETAGPEFEQRGVIFQRSSIQSILLPNSQYSQVVHDPEDVLLVFSRDGAEMSLPLGPGEADRLYRALVALGAENGNAGALGVLCREYAGEEREGLCRVVDERLGGDEPAAER